VDDKTNHQLIDCFFDNQRNIKKKNSFCFSHTKNFLVVFYRLNQVIVNFLQSLLINMMFENDKITYTTNIKEIGNTAAAPIGANGGLTA
jgi:hypothetical protein